MDFKKELTERYPREVELQDKTKVSLRPIKASDEKPLTEFFKRLPVNERELFKDDVIDPEVIRKWCTTIDYNRILPILATIGEKVVGDATLHRNGVRASNHVASIKVSVDSEFRGRGLAQRMVMDLMELAPKLGVAYLDAEVMPEQKRAIELFEDLEFISVGTLPQHARDLNDQFHDIILLTHMTRSPEELALDSAPSEEEVDIGGSG